MGLNICGTQQKEKKRQNRQEKWNKERTTAISKYQRFDAVYVYRMEELERGPLPKLAPKWVGPSCLLNELSERIWEVRLVSGKTARVHVDCIRRVT